MLTYWGLSLMYKANTLSHEAAAYPLLKEAEKKRQLAIRMEPEDRCKLDFWDNVIDRASFFHSKDMALRLLNMAQESIRKPTPDLPEHLLYMLRGHILFKKGQVSDDSSSFALYSEAISQQEKAISIRPDFTRAFEEWALALFSQSEITSGGEKISLLLQAERKLKKALEIVPTNLRSLVFQGVCVARRAEFALDNERATLFAEAEAIYLRCESLETGIAAYNSACCHSVRNQFDEARRWLEINFEQSSYTDIISFKKDKDLDSLRDFPWFQEMMSKLS